MNLAFTKTSHGRVECVRLRSLAWLTSRGNSSSLAQATCGDQLVMHYESGDLSKPLIVDCRGVTDIGQYALAGLKQSLLRLKRSLVFTSANGLRTRLDAELGTPTVDYPEIGWTAWYSSTPAQQCEEMRRTVDDDEAEKLRVLVQSCYERLPVRSRLHSTPLMANGTFDARKIISKPTEFHWLSLKFVELVESTLEKIEAETRSVVPTHLLAVSLRGAPLAAAIRLLSTRGWGLEIIDHMGPKHAVFEEHNLTISRRECNYLYVGDFLIGGTELRIAQIHARARGAELLHAAVIGNWLPASVFQTTVGIDVCSLVELQTCGTDANFGFTS